MKSRRVPIVSTLVVALAVLTMVMLGVWQLGRADEKEALIARYVQAGASNAALVAFPASAAEAEQRLYRRSRVECLEVLAINPVAGTRADGKTGWAYRATCRTPEGRAVEVALGFSADLRGVGWSGGAVSGVVAPGPRLVASTPVAGLEPLARPDPNSLPNNHMAYAVQWFLFAGVALVIYAAALRLRRREEGGS